MSEKITVLVVDDDAERRAAVKKLLLTAGLALAGEADFGFPTIDDERDMSGIDDPEAVAAIWSGAGCGEVIVKLGAKGCRLPDGTIMPPAVTLTPVDSSGAGDAFGAGYLAHRLRSASPEDAARRAHELAGWTVMRSGALPQRDHAAPYSLQ